MARKISQLSPGATIYLNEFVDEVKYNIPYFYMGLDGNGKANLLRKNEDGAARRMNPTNVASYEGCEVDMYLENTVDGFLSRFDAATIAALAYTDISYTDPTKDPNLQTISRRCFLPSVGDLGTGGAFLAALKVAKNTTNDNFARKIGYGSGYSGPAYWLRSGGGTTSFSFIRGDGLLYWSGQSASSTALWTIRPALSFDPDTSVSDEGEPAIFLLPENRDTDWHIQVQTRIGITDKRPEKIAYLTIPSYRIKSTLIQVCNNYADVEPTWINYNTEGQTLLGTAKTSDYWELGIKIYATSRYEDGYISQPQMAVMFEQQQPANEPLF